MSSPSRWAESSLRGWLAVEHPDRVARLVLVATGGVDVARPGGSDWRPEYRALLPDVPHWFEEDGTDFTDRLGEIRRGPFSCGASRTR